MNEQFDFAVALRELKEGSKVARSGWRSAVNTAIAQTTTTSGNTVRNYLKPNSPFFMMVDDLE